MSENTVWMIKRLYVIIDSYHIYISIKPISVCDHVALVSVAGVKKQLYLYQVASDDWIHIFSWSSHMNSPSVLSSCQSLADLPLKSI